MKILQIIPGSGGSFYCGNCLRDSKFVEALRASEHEVIKLPMYLPLFANEHDLSKEIPVFYGAISLYLKQQYPIFRRAPKWFDKALNSKPMLKIAAKFAGSTRAKGLEEMTISMLLGEEGQQKQELEKMVDWVAENLDPDVIHISNALLLGLARQLKEKIGVPVFCSLQDEDVWVDVMNDSARDAVWKLMSEKSEDVDAFISVSNYFAEVMKSKMSLPEEKIKTVHIGIYPEEYQFALPSSKKRNIGYVSRMSHENGFHILVDAFIALKKHEGFEDVKLIVTGGSTGDDRKFIAEQKQKLKEAGCYSQFEIHEDFEEEGLRAYFKKVRIISVPVVNGEAFGIYLLEAMASGIPVVQPELGAFPEIIKESKGGVIYSQNNGTMLASKLTELLTDEKSLDELAETGRKGVAERFHVNGQVKKMLEVYYQGELNE